MREVCRMGLQSKQFKGDSSLEACLVRDSAHVAPGTSGDHVMKIQNALMSLDNLPIDPGEITARRYGRSTAAAVLSFKRKRNIVNRAYQTQADDIVGKMTIAALDRELFAKEVVPRREIRCSPAPRFTRNLFAPNPVVNGPSFRLASFRLAAAPVTTSPLGAARRHLPDAIGWTMFALGKLESVRLFLSLPKQDTLDSAASAIFDALNTHFHYGFLFPIADKDTLLTLRSRIGQLIITYRLIQNVLGRPDEFFVEDLSNTNDFASADLGGMISGGKIRFCPPYLTIGPKFQTAVIVHEGAHFVDGGIVHFASELPAPAGTPVGSSKNYASLSFDEARRNAYSYAQFALHCFESFDHRLNFPTD
jgi:hypothetical protein